VPEEDLTETEWLTCERPDLMLTFLGDRAGARRLRLFACACCRLVWHWLDDHDTRAAVLTAERFADGEVGPAALARAAGRVPGAEIYPDDPDWESLDDAAGAAIECCTARDDLLSTAVEVADRVAWCEGARWMYAAEADLLRCILGNPFRRSLPLPDAVLGWNDRTVPRMAESVYRDRAFDLLPLLADALLDAGCDDEELLAHLRSGEPHVRGCWGLDLILGKE
jgi:hypothetical protein